MKAYLPLCLLGVLAVICRADESSQVSTPDASSSVTPGLATTPVAHLTPGTASDLSSARPAPRQNLTTALPDGMTTTAIVTSAGPETNSSSSSSASPPDISHTIAFQETTEEDRGTVMSTNGNGTTFAVDTGSSTAVGGPDYGVPSSGDIAGYVILFFLLIAIVGMVIILYLLRRRSRKYSFDLHRPGYDHGTPLTLQEQPGTFECVTEGHQEKAPAIDEAKDDAPPALANGTSPTGDGGVARDNSVTDSYPDGDSFNLTVTPPLKKVDFSLDIDLSDRASNQSGSTFSFLGGAEAEQQNENNNNDTNMSEVPVNSDLQTEVFTEISLDETV